MDILALILTTLTALLSPVGLVVDSLAEQALRQQTDAIEAIQVRVDNAPNYQILSGRINHLRISARGVRLRQLPDLRIEAISLEADPLDVNVARLRAGELQLDKPAQAALRLQLKADDLNAFLASERMQAWLDSLQVSLPGPGLARQRQRYGLANPSLEVMPGDRLRIVVDLQDRVNQESIPVLVELGLAVIDGYRLELVDPKIKIDGAEAPSQLISALASGASQEFTLKRLEEFGLTTRILALNLVDHQLDLAIFARIEPTSPFLVKTVRSPTSASLPPIQPF
jgi:hypothetical protein